MSKYSSLHDFLLNSAATETEKTLTFDAIEKIIGSPLPESALTHRAWWANPTSPDDHPYAQAWLTAGWFVESVNQAEKWVRFQRK